MHLSNTPDSCRLIQTLYPSPVGILTLICDTTGLVAIQLPKNAINSQEVTQKIKACTGQSPILSETIRALDACFRSEPFIPPKLSFTSGTTLQKAVWQEIAKIPTGTTRTYKEIAEAIGNPRAIRAVATAIGKNPHTILIPCHRVIGSNGSLTGYAGGLDIKRRLLEIEGIRMK